MYRAVTLLALREGLGPDDEESLIRLAKDANIRFEQTGQEDEQQIYCCGENVTEEIRSLPVSEAVSGIAAVAGVREALVEAQRKMAADQHVVMDGRDIGTVVLPEAECKIYLTASAEERARRRKKERAGKAKERTLEEITAEIRKRDEDDMSRENSPLRQAEDSVLLDTTYMHFQESVDAALEIVRVSQKSGT